MFVGSATGPPPKQRRSPRFPFDSLLRVTLFPLAEGTGLVGPIYRPLPRGHRIDGRRRTNARRTGCGGDPSGGRQAQ
jgi:hypothetical protein